MSVVRVVYGRASVEQVAAARRCQRCQGTGRERHVPGECPNCAGDGVARYSGWAYNAPAGLFVGDVVLCPPTPRSNGERVEATVIGFDSAVTPYATIIERVL